MDESLQSNKEQKLRRNKGRNFEDYEGEEDMEYSSHFGEEEQEDNEEDEEEEEANNRKKFFDKLNKGSAYDRSSSALLSETHEQSMASIDEEDYGKMMHTSHRQSTKV